MVWDVERGAPDKPQSDAWQTCTCIGHWHYNRGVYESNSYKSAATVIRMLVDIVSKNGNLLLNIPVRGDGTIDEKEVAILEGIATWMDVNKESIFDTRPWKIFGEGPSVDAVNNLNGAGFNEGKVSYTEKDIRYNQKGNVIYATVMGQITGDVPLKSLADANGEMKIEKIELLGSDDKLSWNQDKEALIIKQPKVVPNSIATVFKIYRTKS